MEPRFLLSDTRHLVKVDLINVCCYLRRFLLKEILMFAGNGTEIYVTKKSNLQSFYDDLRVGFIQKQPAGIVKVFHIFVLYFGRSSWVR